MPRSKVELQGSFSKLAENIRDAFVSVNMQGSILEFNHEYWAMLGYTADEIRKLTYRQITPPEWHAFEEHIVQTQVLARGYSDVYEKEYIRKDGSILPVELRTILVRDEAEQPAAMWAFVRDISARKRAEQALKESEGMSRAILDASSASIFMIDPDGTFLMANEAGARRLNASIPELIGKCAFNFFPPEVAEKRKQMMEQVCRSGQIAHYDDTRAGLWFENSVHPIKDENSRVHRLVIIASDVTERIRMIEALQSSEERYRGLAETAQDSIFIIDRDDIILYVNAFGARWLGLPAAQVIGKKRSGIFGGSEGDRQFLSIQRTLETGQPQFHEAPSRAQGKTYWLSTRLVPLKDHAGENYAVLGVARDITERVRTERALIRAKTSLEVRVARRTSELEATQARLRTLANQIITTQEEERRRVSRELHDDASQMLVSLRYNLAALMEEAAFDERHGPAQARMASALELVDSVTDHIRSLGHSLRPPALEVGGIHISLKEFCREFTGITNIPVDYQGVDLPGLPQETGISLYRFVQEALTNVLKHAHASQVQVRLRQMKNGIQLTISDNGSGFSGASNSKGIGLIGMEERINLAGGNLAIRSRAGKGVTLVARIPWEPDPKDQPAAERQVP